jgi:hypothetical protein
LDARDRLFGAKQLGTQYRTPKSNPDRVGVKSSLRSLLQIAPIKVAEIYDEQNWK